jgi:hypothetical protein
MENFNKNWLAILLIAIIFLILGFLLGRVTGHHHRGEGKDMRKMIFRKGPDDSLMRFEEGQGDISIKIDTLVNDGKKLEVTVQKRIKK